MRIAPLFRFGFALLLMGGMGAATAEAGSGRYGSVVIRNPTSNTLFFQMRLADNAPWEEFEVPSETDFAVHFELDNKGLAYTPNIRFDYIGGDGRVTYKYYELEFYEVNYPYWHDGKPYKFEYDSSGDYLELYTAD